MRHFYWERPLLLVSAAAGLSALLVSLEFNLLELHLYDFRARTALTARSSARITLVTIDDASAKALGELAPLPLEWHARFLEKLETWNPRAVGYLSDLGRATRLAPEQLVTGEARRFVNAATRIAGRGAPLILATELGSSGQILPPYPLSSLPLAVATIDPEGFGFSEDRTIRRALVRYEGKPSLDARLAQAYLGQPLPLRGSFSIPGTDSAFINFRYHADPARWWTQTERDPLSGKVDPQAYGTAAWDRVSFVDVLSGSPRAQQLIDGAIVLVGDASRADSSDFAFTPFSKDRIASPKIALHAETLATLIENRAIRRPSVWVTALSTFVLVASVLWAVLALSPALGVLATLGLSLGFVALCHVAYAWKGLWLTEAQPLIGVFLAYYLTVPYRLTLEHRKRWEVQKRNNLLVQVEELKTNFLSLVTHDLKTPVARIQGQIERLARRAADRLTPEELEILRQMSASSDELNRFITMLLELHAMESERLSIRPEVKDLNRLIESAVESLQALAQSREILIKLELEALFPVQLDPTLILKVLANLIDNAIKYSPERSTVIIRSHELDADHVAVSVMDQGPGLNAEERERVFTKFYRAPGALTQRVAGTGLGLYLTRYFVEAHNGKVHIESTPDQGSTFTIELPYRLAREPGLRHELSPQPQISQEANHASRTRS